LKVAGLLLALACAASAHVISMSNGFATVTGNRVEYILRMPVYEVPSGVDPASRLLGAIRFTSGFETARRLDGECHADAGTYLCAANYAFSAPVEKLGVDCRLYEVTVPNHIHMLHAERGGKFDQAILDSAFPSASLAFRPPTAVELAVEQSGAGAMRVWTNAAQVLLLVALALAARSGREFAVLTAAFLVGECGGTLALLRTGWQPSLRFAEAAAALALAYLALEILAFPKSGGRWMLGLVFGAFQGMFFSLFVGESGYAVGWVLAGAAVGAGAVALACGVLGVLLARTAWQDRIRAVASGALMAVGGVWFVLRLRS
jgi:hypothetical protein